MRTRRDLNSVVWSRALFISDSRLSAFVVCLCLVSVTVCRSRCDVHARGDGRARVPVWLLRSRVLDIFKIGFLPHRPRLVRLIYRHGARPVNSTTYEAPVLREAPAEQ